jgi:glucose/mannose transport system substrate-binding protein
MKLRLTLIILVVFLMAMVGSISAQSDLTGQLEVFSWWAGSDGGPALEALINLYNQQNPGVEVINATVTGGSGVNAQAVLKTRMLGGNPPDTFQAHAGQELTGTWVVANRMEDLSFLYDEQGWRDVFPAQLIEQISYEGGIYSVPVNIHRSNVMWFVPANLEAWGVTAPTTWDEFLTTCSTLQAAGVTPLEVGEAWTVYHLWESVALGVLGPDNWNALWTGGLAPDSPEMVEVWNTFGQVLDCSNFSTDAAGLSWQQATDAVLAGTAAFNIMGDWAAGYMTATLGLEPGTGFGWAPSPGTGGTFMWLADSFGLPVGAPNRDNAIAWLTTLGSLEGQNAFNPLKGSIPARTDAVAANPDLYNAYSQSAAADWGSNSLAGSLWHGVVANDNFKNNFSQIMDIYTTSRSAEAAASAMLAVCAQAGACGF